MTFETAWDPELDAMCKTPLRWERCVSETREGVRTYAPAQTVYGHVAPAPVGTRNVSVFRDGMPRQLIVLKPVNAQGLPVRVTIKDRITLPDDEAFSAPYLLELKDCTPVFDEMTRVHHYEVLA